MTNQYGRIGHGCLLGDNIRGAEPGSSTGQNQGNPCLTAFERRFTWVQDHGLTFHNPGNVRVADEPSVTELQPTIPRLLRPISQMFLLGFDEIVGPVTLFGWRSRQQSTRGAV